MAPHYAVCEQIHQTLIHQRSASEMITSEIQEIMEFKQRKLLLPTKNRGSPKQIHEEIEAKSKFIITMSVGESEYVTCLFNDLTTKPWSIREMKNKIRDKGIEIGESKYDSWIIAEENLKRLAEAPKINLFFFKHGRVCQIVLFLFFLIFFCFYFFIYINIELIYFMFGLYIFFLTI